jgi:2-polyprenyl-3-methyl-5-hydroxy-6-metoxy-1,4-benzoquinol methylase
VIDLRQKLIRDYASHYARHNDGLGPVAQAANARAHLDASYGDIVASLAPGSEVLDLGCGSGYLLAWLSTHGHLRVAGVDTSESQIAAAANDLPGVHVECGDGIRFLRRHPGRFAAIFCLDVLEHIPDDQLLDWLTATHDALMPGGLFICKVPNAANLTAAQLRYIDLTHVRSFTGSSLQQLLEAADFVHCRMMPVRAGRVLGSIRGTVEWLVHKALYRLCGNGRERIFTLTLIGVGEKNGHSALMPEAGGARLS